MWRMLVPASFHFSVAEFVFERNSFVVFREIACPDLLQKKKRDYLTVRVRAKLDE